MILHNQTKGIPSTLHELELKLKTLYNHEIDDSIVYELNILAPDDPLPHMFLLNKLDLTQNLLSIKNNPKSYIAWHFRRKIIKQVDVDFDRERKLMLVCFESDERNFHCWNYKRFLFGETIDIALLLFKNNFSNYSAIHDLLVYDYKLCLKQQMYTDPEDEGLWAAFRILKNREITSGRFVLKVYSDYFVIWKKEKIEMILINDKEIAVEDLIDKRLKVNKKLILGDIVTVNNVDLVFEKKGSVNSEIVDELINWDNCLKFPLLEKLDVTHDIDERKCLIDKLVLIDPCRKGYYNSLLHSSFHILYN